MAYDLSNFVKTEFNMDAPILTDDITTMFDSELIGFLSRRYKKSPSDIIRQFLMQNERECSGWGPSSPQKSDFTLEINEMEILRAYYNR